MFLCDKDCIRYCDFCIYAIHDRWEENGKEIVEGPIECTKHLDEEHQEIAEGCGSCPDCPCFRVNNGVDINQPQKYATDTTEI